MNTQLSAEIFQQQAAEVYAIVDGIPVALPTNAKFICQDRRGSWYFCERRPRIKDGDWTPNKTPIQIRNDHGYLTPRVLQTAAKKNWQRSLQTTIKRKQLPMAH